MQRVYSEQTVLPAAKEANMAERRAPSEYGTLETC
jgi:hypothetical protein